MNENYIPQRGVDFDDYAGTLYFASKRFGISNVQLNPLFCGKNGKHDDDFIGISYSGYRDGAFVDVNGKEHKADGLLIQGIMYPAKNFTAEDLSRMFDKVELEDGEVKYTPKSNIRFDEVFIRVCYAIEESERVRKIKAEAKHTLSIGELDNLKWVAGVDGGEVVALHGDRRKFAVKDAEA